MNHVRLLKKLENDLEYFHDENQGISGDINRFIDQLKTWEREKIVDENVFDQIEVGTNRLLYFLE